MAEHIFCLYPFCAFFGVLSGSIRRAVCLGAWVNALESFAKGKLARNTALLSVRFKPKNLVEAWRSLTLAAGEKIR